MADIVPFDGRTAAERGLADALKAELDAERAYEAAVNRVTYWTGQVALERELHLIETEHMAYVDPLTHIRDMDREWDNG